MDTVYVYSIHFGLCILRFMWLCVLCVVVFFFGGGGGGFARIVHLVLLPTTGFGCLEIIYMIYLL